MAQKKWNVVRLEKTRKLIIFMIPPIPDMGGQYIVLLYTVAKETHLIIPANKSIDYSATNFLLPFLPRATSGPQ